MSNITDQLAAALAQEPWPAKVRLGDHLFQNSYDDGSYYCYELRASIKFADRAALAAFDTQPAADDGAVERVARAIYASLTVGPWENLIPEAQAEWRNRARAAIAAMGERDGAPGYIPMPRNLDEARAMSLLADAYLRANAPDTKGSGQ